MSGPLENGLRSRQLDIGIESIDQRAITIAGEQGTETLDPHRAIHFGETALGHVEIEVLVVSLDDAEVKRAIFRPRGQRRFEVIQCAPAEHSCECGPMLVGELHDHFPRDREGSLFAELLRECREKRRDDASFDFPLPEDPDVV